MEGASTRSPSPGCTADGRGRSWRRSTAAVAVLALAAALPVPAAAGATTDPGEVYLVHAVAGVTADISVDGQVVQEDAAPKAIVGPLRLAAGAHEVSFVPSGAAAVTSSLELAPGASVDVVAHQGADPASPAVLTVFPNDVSAVAPGKARLVVAHTATVPPADVRVDGAVLFSNVANGEALSLVVPGGSYQVDIVPAATDGPVVFGPVDLSVAAEQLNRVYAFGNPGEASMDAIVRTSPLPVDGAVTPDLVDTGNGGQVAALQRQSDRDGWSSSGLTIALALLAAAAAAIVARSARRRRAVPSV